jgi:hypothetical protein
LPVYGDVIGSLPDEHPASADWYSRVLEWPMLLNDRIGDCTIAAAGHVAEQWRVYAAREWPTMTNAEAEAAYADITGYTPGEPSTDQGAVCQDVLRYWRKHGIMAASRNGKLTGYPALAVSNMDHIKHAVATFGSVYAGIKLPESAEVAYNVTPVGKVPVWNYRAGSDVMGGHSVPLVGYDESYLYAVSWGELVKVTRSFWDRYAEEAFVPVSREWCDATGVDPAGVKWDALQAGMEALQ